MLRTLFKSDLPQLLEIEKAVHISPWTDETFKSCFQSGCVGWVIELNKKIIGFILIALSVDECHVLNLCVTHEFQHQGWGRKLLEKALEHAKQFKTSIAYLEVRRSNTRAISLYKNMNFQLIGQRKGYYPTEAGNEDALIFAMSLRDSPL